MHDRLTFLGNMKQCFLLIIVILIILVVCILNIFVEVFCNYRFLLQCVSFLDHF